MAQQNIHTPTSMWLQSLSSNYSDMTRVLGTKEGVLEERSKVEGKEHIIRGSTLYMKRSQYRISHNWQLCKN